MTVRVTARPTPQPNHDASAALAALCPEGRCHASDTNALLCHKNTLQRVSVTMVALAIGWLVACGRGGAQRDPAAAGGVSIEEDWFVELAAATGLDFVHF